MPENTNTNSNVSDRAAAKAAKANEESQLDAQSKQFYSDFNAAKDKNAFLETFAKDKLNMSVAQVAALREEISTATTEEEQSRILEKAFGIAMPVWFLKQIDNTKIASGLHKLDTIVPLVTVENGAVRRDYQDIYKPDGKDPYYGSQKDSGKTWVTLTQGNKPLTDFENYTTKHNIHMTVIKYLPLFTNAHKDTMLFMLQFSNVLKQLGEPLLIAFYGVRGKLLWDPTNFDTYIDDTTNDDFVVKESDEVTPDFTIEAKTFKEVPTKLNSMVQKWSSPTRTHYGDNTSDAAKLMMINGGKNLTKQLRRSLSMDSLQVIVPYEFINYLNNYQLAGSFHKGDADILDKFKEAMVGFNYDVDFGEEYANIKGIQNSLTADEKGNVTGSVDIVVKTKGVLRLINQFDSKNTFGLPNNTEAINTWSDFGKDIDKSEEEFYARIRITVGDSNPSNTAE